MIIFSIIIFILQNTIINIFAINNITFDLFIIFLCLLFFLKKINLVFIYIFTISFFSDISSNYVLGLYLLIYTFLFFLINILYKYLNFKSYNALFLFLIIFIIKLIYEIINNIIYNMTNESVGVLSNMFTYIVPCALYTSLIGVLLFKVFKLKNGSKFNKKNK